MQTFLLIVHLIVCFAVIMVVLLQTGKGAEMGAMFGGGGSNTLFGSRGPGTFLTKLTAAAGAMFMLTSLGLAMLSTQITGGSVVEEAPVTQQAPAEQAPEAGEPFAPAPDVTFPGQPGTEPAMPEQPAGQQ